MDLCITSQGNAQYKYLRGLLASKKERDNAGVVVCEGLRLCIDALQAGLALQTLFVTPQALVRYPQTQQLRYRAQQECLLADDLMRKAGDTHTPQGVVAVFKRLDNARSTDTMITNGTHFLLLHQLQDPGNVGAVIRTAAALGISGVWVSADSADPYSPKALRASMGGVFRVPVCTACSLPDAIAGLQQNNVPVYAAALAPGACPPKAGMFAGRAAMVIGNEGNGLPQEIVAACDAAVAIPMHNGTESLGAAMAAGILMWEMRRESRGE
jgi:rRNA methylases